ncbi:hypothetical protein ACFL2T_00425 [Elusimicrobiota bacterium]
MMPRLVIFFSLLLLGHAGPVPAAAGSDPMAREYRRMSAKGYEPEKKASARVPGGRLVAVNYGKAGGGSWLNVYRVDRDRARLLHMKPGSSLDISLASIHHKGRIPDLAGDGSRIIAYRIVFPGIGQEKLAVYRYARGKLSRVETLPYGRFEDLDGDGSQEIVSRSQPLGQFFMLGCESSVKMTQTAFRTRVYAWRKGRLVRSSVDYPEFYDRHIRELREDIAALNPRSTKTDPGAYMGLGLAVYFDHEELGQGRRGWREFLDLSPVRKSDPSRAKRCVQKTERELRKRLRIPGDW